MISVLTGSNSFLVAEKLATIKSEFVTQHSVDGVESYNGDQIQPEDVANIFLGVTLFAQNRLVVIKDLSTNKEAAERLLSIIEIVPSEVHVVLVESQLDKRTNLYKVLKQQADFYEFNELDEAALTQWVSEYVKNAGGRVDAGSARLLTNYVGSNQLQLKNELDKLVAYDPTITSETIELLVERRPQDTVFQLLDSALSGNQKKALEILDNLEAAHEDAFQVANLLIWQTHILAVVQSAGTVTEAEIAKAAKLNPYVVRKTKGLVARLSKTQVNKIVDRVAELDVLLKTSAVNPWRALEQILVALQV